VIAYLAFSKPFEILYDPSDVVSLDVNENNVTIAVFRDDILTEAYVDGRVVERDVVGTINIGLKYLSSP
jgi:transposase